MQHSSFSLQPLKIGSRISNLLGDPHSSNAEITIIIDEGECMQSSFTLVNSLNYNKLYVLCSLGSAFILQNIEHSDSILTSLLSGF